ncbi:expansin-like B1 [Actinidia eriantha]|uniref:expansin-like B1 n=1 Tax=Actinidia eriantha TaxID=165200 RepID=UPI0025855AD5|nr:expansin-like B1 [Actinidia eriantha]
MGFSQKTYCSLLFVMVLLPALGHSQDAYVSSRATFYGSPDCLGTPTGACGFGDYGRTVNDGSVSGVSRLYKNGTGCGACYQVRCKIPQLCIEDGVRVVVTDYGEGDKTDFVLSTRAFSKLARPNTALELFAYGVVDIEFRGIPCQYPGYNLMVKVHEHSRFPEYLAVVLLYQAGKNYITAVEVWQANCQQWSGMRRSYGAVWDMANPPAGALNFRVQVSGSAGPKWVQLSSVLPSEWKAGAVYDTSIQLY